MSNNSIKAVERVFDILECFTVDNTQLGISEISRMTGMYKSTAHRIIQSLVCRGILVQDEKNKKYMLGFKVFELGAVASSNIEVRKLALPFMEELGEHTRESINLSIEDKGERVCIEKVESKEYVRNFVHVGMRGPLYQGATGKTLLAFIPPERIENILGQLDETSFDRVSLLKELSEIREKNYNFSFGERVEGAASVCAPLKDYNNEVVAVLTVSGPTMRFTSQRVDELIKEVKEYALKISKRLGFSGSL